MTERRKHPKCGRIYVCGEQGYICRSCWSKYWRKQNPEKDKISHLKYSQARSEMRKIAREKRKALKAQSDKMRNALKQAREVDRLNRIDAGLPPEVFAQYLV